MKVEKKSTYTLEMDEEDMAKFRAILLMLTGTSIVRNIEILRWVNDALSCVELK